MKIKTVTPATGEMLEEYHAMNREDVRAKVEAARKALVAWKNADIAVRSKLVKKLGRRMTNRKKKLAEAITKEMGKPLKESIPEVEKCAWLCEYYARNARKILKDDKIKTEYKKSYVTFEPIGIVGSILSWDFPMWQAMRIAIPSLMAGNVHLIKPSSITPNSGGMLLEQIFEKSKFPSGVFQAVVGDASTGTMLAEAKIDAITLTGSTETGKRIAQIASHNLRKVVLELSGNDPFIVLADADIKKAAEGAVAGRFLNCGQSCVSAKRIIVVKDVADKFTKAFIETTEKLRMGDPMEADTDIGPMARYGHREQIEKQVADAIAQGGKILTGGKKVEKKGFYFEPTIMTATNAMAIAREELFGPVALVITAENEDDAIKIANDTDYGLGASIWTQDIAKGEALTKKIQAGMVYVNKNVRSDPRMPFGGVKQSGLGRELALYGLLEMVNIKSVIVN